MLTSEPCPFCQILRGDGRAELLHQDANVAAVRDIRPVAPTHILIIPVRHIRSLQELHAEDEGLLERMIWVAREIAIREGVDASGYRLVINTGPAAGQTVYHLHLHLLAGRRMSWPPG